MKLKLKCYFIFISFKWPVFHECNFDCELYSSMQLAYYLSCFTVYVSTFSAYFSLRHVQQTRWEIWDVAFFVHYQQILFAVKFTW